MDDDKHRILGVHVTERVKRAADVQSVLSKHGRIIRTRLGLHHVHNDFGLILLELYGEERECEEMHAALAAIEGVEVKEMVFEHLS